MSSPNEATSSSSMVGVASDSVGPSSATVLAPSAVPSATAPNAMEFEPPLACVRRILKNALPSSTNVGKDASAAFARACGIFIIYITACANDFAREHKRQTITANDVLEAVKELDFEEFSPDMIKYLEAHRAMEKDKKSKKEAQKQKKQSAATPDDGDDEEHTTKNAEATKTSTDTGDNDSDDDNDETAKSPSMAASLSKAEDEDDEELEDEEDDDENLEESEQPESKRLKLSEDEDVDVTEEG